MVSETAHRERELQEQLLRARTEQIRAESALKQSERRAAELHDLQTASARRAAELEAEQGAKDLDSQRIKAQQQVLFEEAVEARLAEEAGKFQLMLEEARASHLPLGPVGEDEGWEVEHSQEEAHSEEEVRYQEQWFPEGREAYLTGLGLSTAQIQGVMNFFSYVGNSLDVLRVMAQRTLSLRLYLKVKGTKRPHGKRGTRVLWPLNPTKHHPLDKR